jgi:hypothetical protein
MQRPLSEQKRIDILAIALALGLSLLIALAASWGIGAAFEAFYNPGKLADDGSGDTGVVGAFAFASALFLLSPLWVWLGFRLRRWLGWPRGAFEGTGRVSE